MSAIAKVPFALVLLLGFALGGATNASAATLTETPRGIWVKIDTFRAWTLTVINLTNYPLSLAANSVTTTGGQRPPFHGNTLNGEPAFPLAPYQNVTWKSNTATVFYPHPRWNGTISFLPQGMDTGWTVNLNFSEYWFNECADPDYGCPVAYGTWAYLTADFGANPYWFDQAQNISCSYPSLYDRTYNVLMLSGSELVASLYAPYVDIGAAPTVNITLVVRERYGDQDPIEAPCLKYQDNTGKWDRLPAQQ
jgi:hypothetical protein